MTNHENNISENALSGFIQAAGVILAVSYPVLALSAGVRSFYQLFLKEGVTNQLPALLSGVAAILYLLATLGFVIRKRWAWRLSVSILSFELAMVLLIGTLSVFYPDAIGHTVWGRFGADYAYFPLIQPLLGLAWLFHRQTRTTYGIGKLAVDA
ncbi:MAG: hypothetical protein KA586_04775 [Candidatus Promineofilum sp.]|nr:hypothetical protein [Promineifilum sp.]